MMCHRQYVQHTFLSCCTSFATRSLHNPRHLSSIRCATFGIADCTTQRFIPTILNMGAGSSVKDNHQLPSVGDVDSWPTSVVIEALNSWGLKTWNFAKENINGRLFLRLDEIGFKELGCTALEAEARHVYDEARVLVEWKPIHRHQACGNAAA